MVLEKEAESLKILRSRLADKNPYHNDDILDINGDKTLFPMEPNRGLGGTISSLNYNHQELQCKPFNIEILMSLLRKQSGRQQQQQQQQQYSNKQQQYKKQG